MFMQAIRNYCPDCEQEIHDRRMMLQYAQIFDDILYRTNETVHFTASPWIVNPTCTHVLMIHHNIYNSWSWVGGHADGNPNLLEVALKEATEETGAHLIRPISSDIFSIEILPVIAHFKRGQYVVPHLHLNATYLIEADDHQLLHSKPDENSAVRWFPLETAAEMSNEPAMQVIYRKLNDKVLRMRTSAI